MKAATLTWRITIQIIVVAVGIGLGLVAPVAATEAYPQRPITVVLPLGPGGATENLALIATMKASESLGQRIVLEYKPGAGGSIASNTVANAKPDGYTLLFANFATHAATPTMYASLPYDPIADFLPVSLLASQAHVLLVGKGIEANDIKQLVAMLGKDSEAINFASSGIGSPLHLASEYFQTATNTDFGHIPYKSSQPALQDLLGGRVHAMFDNISTGKPYVDSGDLKAIAVTSAERSPLLPDVPTAQEQGLDGFQTYGWWGLLAPKGTPPEIVEKLSLAFQAAMASDEVVDKLSSQGYRPMGTDPSAFKQHIGDEIAHWGKVIEAAGLKGAH